MSPQLFARGAIALFLALLALSACLTAFQVAHWTTLPQTVLLLGTSAGLVVVAFRAVVLSAPTSELDLEAQPICHGCCEPVDPREHYCPRCGATTGKFTAYIPYVNLWFEYDVLGRAWNEAWRAGTAWQRRILLAAVLLVVSPPLVVIGLACRTYGLLSRQFGAHST
jgi:hypothetical protein